MPKVSIVIPNWNGKHFLGRCLESLERQSFKDFEIILVDNGSIDSSREFVFKEFPEVKIIELEKNYGFAKAVNVGILNSMAEYVALLNNDTEATPHWLEELVKIMDKNPKVGFATSKILSAENRLIIDDAGDEFSFYEIAYQRGHGEKDSSQYGKIQEVFSACAAAAIYRRALFDKVGLFDEDFFAYLEDMDLGFRARLAGWECLYVPRAVIYHYGHGSSEKNRNFFHYLAQRNGLYVVIKNVPLKLIIKHLGRLFISQIRNFFSNLRHHYPFWLIMKVHWDVFKSLPRLLVKRKKIQSQRIVSDRNLENVISSRPPHYFRKFFLNR